MAATIPGLAAAQEPQPTITEVRVEQEGRVLTDPELLALIETRIGRPVSMEEVRDSIAHLNGLNRFEGIEVRSEKAAGGVRLVYTLHPLHPIDRVEFRGTPALDEAVLRRRLTERYGAAPPSSRLDEVVELLRQLYRDYGYPSAKISSELVERHDPDRATLVLHVDAGKRAIVNRVEWVELDEEVHDTVGGRPDVRQGRPYDLAEIRRALDRYVSRMREQGYYEANAQPTTTFEDAGAVVTIEFRRGPRVRVVFSGDPLTRSERERLVPIQREASVVDDLLEDWEIGIENYLRDLGHRDADVTPTRQIAGDELTITFDVSKGPRYVTSDVAFEGNMALGDEALREVLRVKEGEPFVESTLDAGAAVIADLYRARGFSGVKVTPEYSALAAERPADSRRVQVTVVVAEGPRTTIRSIAFSGNTVFTEPQLREMMSITEGAPLSQTEVLRSLDSVELQYRNRGYESIDIRPAVSFAGVEGQAETQADVLLSIAEGPQIIIDRVIIEGNERTSRETIERELQVEAGDPWGLTALAESQTRLAGLGLFRRVRLDPRAHPGDTRRDLIVRVDEAPPTTLGFGGGVEASSRLRPTGQGDTAEERIEVVPRGFFEIGRRNMWGKNRQVNLFTRVSARARDTVTPSGVESSYGINEYRIYVTFREPKLFGGPGEVLVTGIGERAIRASYSFDTIEARAQMGGRLSRIYTGAAGFSIENTELFDVDPSLTGDRKPPIDRFFPQVRLSKFSGSLIRNTRDDDLDPSRGTFMSADAEVAARAIGSEVGYVKTFVQGSWYRQLPAARRIVLAVRGVLGAAHGFPREVRNEAGDLETVQDIPASERFFAGGATTNRGFTLDRLGTAETTSPGGFPIGGNAEILLNSEVRVSLFRAIAGVVFLDAGNVFKDAEDMSLADLRPAAGFGVHYRSFVGPVRAEIGFNLDRRELAPGQLERGRVFHISLGPAF
jgi:outer membrane protein insertion porin family